MMSDCALMLTENSQLFPAPSLQYYNRIVLTFVFSAEALALLRAHLPPNAILVGQSILKDVQWLQLAEGVDYFSLIDLSALFRVWNQQRGQYTTFSQDHCAKVWIGVGERDRHNAIEDAAISMSLFNAYRMVQWDPNR
jgi:hypothetical protein